MWAGWEGKRAKDNDDVVVGIRAIGGKNYDVIEAVYIT